MNQTNVVPMMRIKRLFLKILLENSLAGKETHQAYIFHVEIPKKLKDLSGNDIYRVGQTALKDLLSDGYILETKTNGRFRLSEKGNVIAQKEEDKMLLPRSDIFVLISSRYDLCKCIYSDYMAGNFDSVVFKSFKLIEGKIRSKAKLSNSKYGNGLVVTAFNPDRPILHHTEYSDKSERMGLQLLFQGALKLFRNPSGHRNIEWEDPNKIIEIVILAKVLLDLIDECSL